MEEGGDFVPNYDNQKQETPNTFIAFIVGTALGAIGALMLRKENRNKVRETYEQVRHRGEKMFEQARDRAQETREEVEKKTREIDEKMGKEKEERR